MDSLFHNFSSHARIAIKNAFAVALRFGHAQVTPSHLLYGIAQEKGSVGAEIVYRNKLDIAGLKKNLEQRTGASRAITDISLSTSSQAILERAIVIANVHNHVYVGTEHLMAALFDCADKQLRAFLDTHHSKRADIDRHIETSLAGISKFGDLTDALNHLNKDVLGRDFTLSPDATTANNQLEQYAVELTDPEIQNSLDPVIGRDAELSRVIEILSRRYKNNPLLLGDPGVGKTAIIEGLAKKIVANDVPQALRDKKIYSLDIGSLIAGTSFRGEFEQRLKGIIAQLREDKNSIVFIDEIHSIVGAGAATGSVDAANLLKPALARGWIRCIGATTPEEYKKSIESDPALERRFQTINLREPSVAQTITILKGVRKQFELFHGVTISDDALQTAATLSERFITDKFLPDKAIDLVDQSAARVKLASEHTESTDPAQTLTLELNHVRQKKQERVQQHKLAEATALQKIEHELIQKIEHLRTQQPEKIQQPEVTDNDIAQTLHAITGLPVTILTRNEQQALLQLEKRLSGKIFGQDHAISLVANALRRSRSGIASPHRPIGSFLFVGPPGVGKTEFSKVLAEEVFGSPQALIRIDMSEFSEGFNISKLIGAPAGYVGYKDQSLLTDKVKRQPYSVILLDEIEKAHPQIFNLLLQILDDGFVTDATGKQINFRNTIIILTSNIGSRHANQTSYLGFDKVEDTQQLQEHTKSQLQDIFSPEFMNRLDHVVVFNPLSKATMEAIVRQHLKAIRERAKQQGVTLTIGRNVAKHIVNDLQTPQPGGRDIRKHIEQHIEDTIAHKLLSKSQKTSSLTIKVEKNRIKV